MFKIKTTKVEGILEIYDDKQFCCGFIEFLKNKDYSVDCSICKIQVLLPNGKLDKEQYFMNVSKAIEFLKNYLDPVGEN